jgi:hypothetical protein
MAGYSSTPLVNKLGIKPSFTIHLITPPDEYLSWISPLPEDVIIKTKLVGEIDFIHLFAVHEKDFQQHFIKAKQHLKKNGLLWVSWPKKASKVATDLDENKIRDYGLQSGLVDVKVCAVNDVWSGLKFVFRVKDR